MVGRHGSQFRRFENLGLVSIAKNPRCNFRKARDRDVKVYRSTLAKLGPLASASTHLS